MLAPEHTVQFYEDEAFLLDSVAAFCGDAFAAGDSAVVIATGAHREGVASRLRTAGLLPDAGDAPDWFVSLDASETLAGCMRDGAICGGRFRQTIDPTLTRATANGRRARVFGEMVALLAAEGNHAAATRLETLWNEMQQARDFTLLCAYPLAHFRGDTQSACFDDVCLAHSQVIPAEGFTKLPLESDRLREVARLQQRAQRLEAEIADRRQAGERLRVALEAEHAARVEAEAALRSRDEFLSIAAHELRNPLAGLSLHAQVALRRIDRSPTLEPEPVTHTLQSISDLAVRLSRLIDRLLDVTRLESGTLMLEREPTDLARLVARVVHNARGWTDRHDISLTAPESLPASVDPVRFGQVVANLLDNAIKFSPAGDTIDVVLTRPRPGVVEVAVRDRGPGVPPAARERIFERFYQARRDGDPQGLGLGLYISQQIVELHDGAICAEFPPEGGARFVVRVPDGSEAAAPTLAAN